MGFFDSLKGIGRAVGGLFETGIQILGPPLLNIGTQVLASKLLGESSAQRQQRRVQAPPIFTTVGGRLPTGLQRPLNVPGMFPALPRPTGGLIPGVPGFSPPLRRPIGGGDFQTASFPGGTRVAAFPGDRFDPTLGGLAGGFRTAGFDLPGVDIVNPFQSQFAGACPTLFRRGGSVRAIPLVMVPHPETGAPVFYKHAGRPLLFSSDFSAARKVARLARRARRRGPR